MLECNSRGGGGGTCRAGSRYSDLEVQLTRMALHALWYLWSCNKRRSEPSLFTALQSNPGRKFSFLFLNKLYIV